MPQSLVPVLSAGRQAILHGIPHFLILGSELRRRHTPPLVRVQAENDPPQVGVLLQIGIQSAVVESAQGNSVASQGAVQGTTAHQVDRSLEGIDPLLGRVAGEAEGNIFIAAGDISFETGAIQIAGPTLVGEYGITRAVPSHEYAVVVVAVLIQQSALQKTANDLGAMPRFRR